jgi:tetratricopeptide (TPR) repeat protein
MKNAVNGRIPRFHFSVFLLTLLLLSVLAAAQESLTPEAEKLMRAGVECHEAGEFDKAIEYYEKALKLAPKVPGIYYELAFSHLYNENPQTALEYSQKGIELAERQGQNEDLAGLYDLKGSALDDLGRREEAVKVYLEAIARFNVNNTRLYYNLGLTYYRMGERDKAWESLAQSLADDTFHPSSNFLVGKICYELGRKTQSLYSLCYFLLLEPNTERSGEAFSTLRQLIVRNEEEEIGVSNTGDFTGLDLILGLMLMSNSNDPDESDDRLMMRKLEAFFKAASEQPQAMTENGSGTSGASSSIEDLWWKFYIPFFAAIAESEHFETLCRYIGMSGSEESRMWLEENGEKIDALFEWLNDD